MLKKHNGLFEFAKNNGIGVEFWDFSPPVKSVYYCNSGSAPVIGLDSSLLKEQESYTRSLIAENIGYFFTTQGKPLTIVHKDGRKSFSNSDEFCAARWAAEYLIPEDKLIEAMNSGLKDKKTLAKHFCVTEEIISVRLLRL